MASHPLPLSICVSKTQIMGVSGPKKGVLLWRQGCCSSGRLKLRLKCKAAQVSVTEESSSWVPVVPLAALPKGERRVIIQQGESILLLWYKDNVFAIENRSPAEGAYTEGLINAKLTQDGCIVCPTTDSTFDLKTGDIKEWYPKNPVLRALTPALRKLFVYPLKIDDQNIYISLRPGLISDASAEIVFSGKAKPGLTASDVNVEEVRMVVDEAQEGFGFTGKNEIINELRDPRVSILESSDSLKLFKAINRTSCLTIHNNNTKSIGSMSRTSSTMHRTFDKNKFKGVRRRKWGKWVSEIRVPGTHDRLWLGTYATPEAAAVAHDVAVYSLRRPSSSSSSSLDKLKLNFPETLSSYSLQLRDDMSPRSVQKVASDVGMDVDARNIVAAAAKTCKSMVGPETQQNGSSNNVVGQEAQSGDMDPHLFWWGDEDDDGGDSWNGSAEDSTEREALTISIEDYL